MVQEVVGLDTELKLLRFRDGKVLEQPHVPVKVSRSISHRKQRWPILPNGRRRSETAPIDVLMGTQAGHGLQVTMGFNCTAFVPRMDLLLMGMPWGLAALTEPGMIAPFRFMLKLVFGTPL